MAGLCEGGNKPPGSLKASKQPNLDIIRETTLKYTNMPEEDAKKNTGHHATRQSDERNTTKTDEEFDAAERATDILTKWIMGDMWRDYIRQDGPMQSGCGTFTSEREDREDAPTAQMV
ncbi:hypothetical protein ANN_11938 [Periplaneta americana]|uniref:Uncharacterized protein n=1 Tax=Periplaneta americana TaxID=6978 RepID=A0ABQ8T894_PERAM|nr:hypothetical protein ANN_11938 [Periplaneta americana]